MDVPPTRSQKPKIAIKNRLIQNVNCKSWWQFCLWYYVRSFRLIRLSDLPLLLYIIRIFRKIALAKSWLKLSSDREQLRFFSSSSTIQKCQAPHKHSEGPWLLRLDSRLDTRKDQVQSKASKGLVVRLNAAALLPSNRKQLYPTFSSIYG